MTFTFTSKKYEVSDELKAYAEKKIGKIDRLFRSESEASVTFSEERGRYLAEVTLRNNGMYYRVSETTSDMFASIDSSVAAIERQVRKNKTRLAKRLRDGAFERTAVVSAPADDQDETEYPIIRTKRFSMKPMSPEEAILQMDLLGHEFFAFRNEQDDDAFAVVYKRKNGGYGLISDAEDEE
ncbi:MAG: ribosome-associated translation inhibitor RaiA [Oscillospiraceae bacterium]|nr:ribosome-associated translation inhibitor RaiA [Oscillospiraceae bacterium]